MEKLSLKIVKQARELFAGDEIGFSGPEITEFFSQYSNEVPFYWGLKPVPSRRGLFEQCLSIFTTDKQKRILIDLCEYDGPMKYKNPPSHEVKKLKKWLEQLPVEEEARFILRKFNSNAINDYWQKAIKRINKDPEGAITAARSLLETVCKQILDRKKVKYKNEWNTQRLYKTTIKELKITPQTNEEQTLKQIFGGCVTIVNGLATLRNLYSNSHGKGKKYLKPTPVQARLAVNVACSLSLFLIETFEAGS